MVDFSKTDMNENSKNATSAKPLLTIRDRIELDFDAIKKNER